MFSLPEMHLQIKNDSCLVYLFKKLKYEICDKGNEYNNKFRLSILISHTEHDMLHSAFRGPA